MSKKPTKSRANKYEEKVKVNASFEELMGALFPVAPNKKKKEAAPKPKKNKGTKKK